MSAVDDYGQITLAQQISQLPGIAQVLVFGSQKFAVRVQVDPVAAAARNISLEDIRTVVSKTNSNTPVGTMAGEHQNITLTASSAMTRASEYRKVVVAYRNGAPVKLDEVARVIDSVENDQIASLFNNERAIVLAIQRQPDANTVSVVDSVRARLPSYRAQIPAAVNMAVLDHRLADRGLHPGPPDGRHGGARVPRICRDHRDRHHSVGVRVADADTDAVRARAAHAS